MIGLPIYIGTAKLNTFLIIMFLELIIKTVLFATGCGAYVPGYGEGV